MLEFERYYHIYNHANGCENLFREEKNYTFFIDKYREHTEAVAETMAWCLMPNHFHILLRIKSEKEIVSNILKITSTSSTSSTFPKFGTLEKFNTKIKKLNKFIENKDLEFRLKFLSKQFANFFSSYTQSYNKIYNRKGSLFLKNYKKKEINNDEYLRNIILYIHQNPVHHGFCQSPIQWEWSSYSTFANTKTDLFLSLFGDLQNYQWLHNAEQISRFDFKSVEKEIT